MDAIQPNQVIVLTSDQVDNLIKKSVAYHLEPLLRFFTESSKTSFPEKLSKDQALSFLAENGVPTTTGNLYKMTSKSEMPCARIGKRLIFSRTDLLNWIENRSISKTDSRNKTAMAISNSANKKVNRKSGRA